jgi:hypothetical protein
MVPNLVQTVVGVVAQARRVQRQAMKRSNGSQPPACAMACAAANRGLVKLSGFVHPGLSPNVHAPLPSCPHAPCWSPARQAPGPRDCAGAGPGGLAGGGALPRFGEDAIKTVADCAALTGAAPFRADLGGRGRRAGLLPRWWRTLAMWMRWSTARPPSSTTPCQLQLCRHGKAPAHQHRRRHSAGAGAAHAMWRIAHAAPRGQPAARPAWWSTCWTRSCGTRTPTFSATPCPRPRWKPPTPCWPGAGAAGARGGRGARPHADQPHAERRQV